MIDALNKHFPPNDRQSPRKALSGQKRARWPAEEADLADQSINEDHLWVACEALALLLERYVTHLTRGCTPSACVDHGAAAVCANSLLCPVCTRTSTTTKPREIKYFFTSDLGPFCENVVDTHEKQVKTTHVMCSIPRAQAGISALKPRVIYTSYPVCSSRRCWGVTSWTSLALELSALGPHVRYRVLAASDRIQRHIEVTGSTFTQATAVIQRLCRTAGVAFAPSQFQTTAQLIQFARLHSLLAFEPELDRIRYRIALALEKHHL